MLDTATNTIKRVTRDARHKYNVVLIEMLNETLPLIFFKPSTDSWSDT